MVQQPIKPDLYKICEQKGRQGIAPDNYGEFPANRCDIPAIDGNKGGQYLGDERGPEQDRTGPDGPEWSACSCQEYCEVASHSQFQKDKGLNHIL